MEKILFPGMSPSDPVSGILYVDNIWKDAASILVAFFCQFCKILIDMMSDFLRNRCVTAFAVSPNYRRVQVSPEIE